MGEYSGTRGTHMGGYQRAKSTARKKSRAMRELNKLLIFLHYPQCRMLCGATVRSKRIERSQMQKNKHFGLLNQRPHSGCWDCSDCCTCYTLCSYTTPFKLWECEITFMNSDVSVNWHQFLLINIIPDTPGEEFLKRFCDSTDNCNCVWSSWEL